MLRPHKLSSLHPYDNTDDSILDYNQGCDGFHRKSKEIFDNALSGSVTHQLCSDENVFGHINHVPVDCTKGLVVNGWSQGAHVASLAGNYATSLVTAGLFWGNGTFLLFHGKM
jgi:hypothetical protein